MANELTLQTLPPLHGAVAYAIVSNSLGQFWNNSTSAFENYSTSDQSAYAVAMTEQPTDGFYEGNFPTLIITAGTYSVSYYQQIGGSPASTDDVIGIGTVQWGGGLPNSTDLITLNYAKQYLSLTVTTYDTLLGQLIDAASQAVVSYCHNNFVITNYLEFYDLTEGGYKLALKNYPVTALTTVTLFPYFTDPVTVSGSDFIVSAAGIIALKPGATTTATSTSTYYNFPWGFQSVEVVYSAGYATVPNDVQLATAQVVQRLYYASQIDTTKDSERIGDYNYKNRLDAFMTITDEIKSVLNKYKRFVI